MFGRGLGDTYAVFLLPLEREFGWTRSELTSVYSIYLLTHGLTSPLIGVLFDRIGPELPLAQRMAFAHLWLSETAVLRKLEDSPTTNAMIRTTTAPRRARGASCRGCWTGTGARRSRSGGAGTS